MIFFFTKLRFLDKCYEWVVLLSLKMWLKQTMLFYKHAQPEAPELQVFLQALSFSHKDLLHVINKA